MESKVFQRLKSIVHFGCVWAVWAAANKTNCSHPSLNTRMRLFYKESGSRATKEFWVCLSSLQQTKPSWFSRVGTSKRRAVCKKRKNWENLLSVQNMLNLGGVFIFFTPAKLAELWAAGRLTHFQQDSQMQQNRSAHCVQHNPFIDDEQYL